MHIWQPAPLYTNCTVQKASVCAAAADYPSLVYHIGTIL